MEPIRDPAIDRMSWEGWTFSGQGQPQGGLYLLRLRYVTDGLCPEERVVEQRAYYRGWWWESVDGLRLADPRAVIAWRQLSPIDIARLDAGRPLPPPRPLPPTHS